MNTSTSPYEFYGPTLCIRAKWLCESGIVSKSNYNNLVDRGGLNILRSGKGKDNYALAEFESIREDVKNQVLQLCPPPQDIHYNVLQDLILPDNDAIQYFATRYTKPDGSFLSFKKQQEYTTNAILLNACKMFMKKHIGRKTKTWCFNQLSTAIAELDKEKYMHKLPNNTRSLQRVYDAYINESYISLVHGGDGNTNAKQVNELIENIVLSIYSMKNKPFATTVHQIYLQFLGGGIDIVNKDTGELFQIESFHKNGSPITLSEATVWNILNNPKNRILVDKYRSGSLEFNNKHRPHHHRHMPIHSMSKISLDDRDLPRKMHNGKRVKAYYAYDVFSGCVIGASYNRDKNNKLFIDCILDMLKFTKTHSTGVPMELEVEHHLVNSYKDDLMKAGNCFPFVRWCNAGNSQEKRAEHFNKAKKYGYEKRYQDGIGRWYAKSEAHRTIVEKVFDNENNTYKEKQFSYEELVADDREIIAKYNNDLHPNQKDYKGMTRMEVLLSRVNPKCAQFNDIIWARYVGEHTTTTIKRSQYMRVQYADYQLPTVDILDRLKINNYEVDAYFIRESDGNIPKIFIYQNDEFICECEKIERYNEATAEHTSRDKYLIGKQSAYVQSFDSKVKIGKTKISKLELIEKNYPSIVAPEEDIIHHNVLQHNEEDEFEALLRNHNEEAIKKQAINQI